MSPVSSLIEENLRESFDASRRTEWDHVHGTLDDILAGNMDVVKIGIEQDGDRRAYETEIVGRWKTAFSLSDDQLELTRGAASQYLTAAHAILKEHDVSLGAATLSSEQHHALQQALLVEQIEAEKSFMDVLTPEQISALRLRVPVVFDLRFGDGVKLSRSRLLSF